MRCSRLPFLALAGLSGLVFSTARCASSDGLSGVDASVDAAVDVVEVEISSPSKACSPVEVANFKATWVPPRGPHEGSCTVEDLELIVDGCFGARASQPACRSAFDQRRTCTDCFVSVAGEPKYGAILQFERPRVFYRNLPGCIALAEGNLTSSSCGAKIEAVEQCSRKACQGCPFREPPTQQELIDHDACLEEAIGDPRFCLDFQEDAIQCVDRLTGGGDVGPPYDTCFSSGADTVEALLLRYGLLFCGPDPDGGTVSEAGSAEGGVADGSPDAATDARDDAGSLADATTDGPRD